MLETLRDLQRTLLRFEKDLSRLNATTVTRASLLTDARAIVDRYFREIRGELSGGRVPESELLSVDASMQNLLEATHRRTPTSVFKRLVKQSRSGLLDTEKRLLANAGAEPASAAGDVTDRRIIDTLRRLIPSAALAYEQGLLDLAIPSRLSWRGPATDFREALRETLDHLAPDEAVNAQAGFQPEPNTNGPTMKQKVRYVLRQRKKTKAIVETSETAVEAVDGIVGTFVRSVYTRSSISTHTPTDRSEVVRVHDFVKVALCELLEIHIG